MSRFSVRLLCAMAIVIVGALLAVGLMSVHLAKSEVQKLLTEADMRRADAAARQIEPGGSRYPVDAYGGRLK